MDEYMGIIKIFAGNFAPVNWMFCQGQLLPISSYTALFSLLGTTYGGNGQTNFALPDLRGRAPVGMGTGTGLQPINEGEIGGAQAVSLNVSNMPSHTHIATVNGSGALQVNSGNATQSAATAGASIATPGSLSGRTFTGTLGFNTSAPNTNIAGLNMGGLTVTNGLAGGSIPFSIQNPYLGVNYIICTVGLYPSRS